ncbi:hypothetical protein SEUCBS139899_005935 [Sporothrix eucalyptigena]|uniref:alpha-L-rhamnosidase n=1 Tax=Sporothrix eucalyptigena TaxID=1812306 RepID=A0ABP0AXJ7_9PEZI
MTPCADALQQHLRWRVYSAQHDICLPALYVLLHNDVSTWPRTLVNGLVLLTNECLQLDLVDPSSLRLPGPIRLPVRPRCWRHPDRPGAVYTLWSPFHRPGASGCRPPHPPHQRNARFKIATGFAGTPILGHALSKVGLHQLFYRMLYQVTMGATTVWGRWDSKLPDCRINFGEMTSFNHYALGAVADWMHGTVAGLAPVEAGWRRFRVAPVPGGDLTDARATFKSPYGTVSVVWEIKDEEDEEDGTHFDLTVEVPPNSIAEVTLPGQKKSVTVGSGKHFFTTAYDRPVWPPLPLYPQYYPHDDDEP